jgi:hypothetical protein
VGPESDFGADRVWRFEAISAKAIPVHAQPITRLRVLESGNSAITANGGADINIMRDQGGAIVLQQDGTHYF